MLSSPQSPMRDLLAGITRQLTLTQPPPPPPGAAGAARGAAQAATCRGDQHARPARRAERCKGLFGADQRTAAGTARQGDRDRYAALIAFVGKGPGAPIDGALKLLNDLQQQLAQVANAAPGGAAAPPAGGADPAQLLQAEAAHDPQPVQRWLVALAISGNSQRSAGVARRPRRRRSMRRAARPRCASRR